MPSYGQGNSSWKGGLTRLRSADEILSLPPKILQYLTARLLKRTRVRKDGCWLWKGKTFGGRYGRISIGVLSLGTHVVAFVLLKRRLTGGKFVCHTCDCQTRVNPAHLFLGIPVANSSDMVVKGRQARGEKNARHKLTAQQVRELRRLTHGKNLFGVRERLAKKFRVHVETISNIVHRRTWRTA